VKIYSFIFLLILGFFFGCKEDQSSTEYNRLRMPADEKISLVSTNKMTGEERSINLDSSQGNVLFYKMDSDPSEDVPSLKQLIAQMVGGENTSKKTQEIRLKQGVLKLIHLDSDSRYYSRLKYQWQDPRHPELQKLIDSEKLAYLIKDKAEIESFEILMNWVRRQWQPSTPNPYPDWNGNTILKMIRSKQTGGFCGQYSQLLSQALTGLGYQTRYLWLKNHFALEVYSNTLDKWICLDPFYNTVYKKGDIYCNAYEVYAAVHAGLEIISCVNTANQELIEGDSRQKILSHYERFIIDLKNNHLEERRQGVSYVQDFWSHSAVLADMNLQQYDFADGYPLMVPNLSDLYTGINQSSIRIEAVNSEWLSLSFKTNTVFHKVFEISLDGGENYKEISNVSVRVPVRKGLQKIHLRSVNVMGVKGAVARLVYEY
jgi:hypothetical protein